MFLRFSSLRSPLIGSFSVSRMTASRFLSAIGDAAFALATRVSARQAARRLRVIDVSPQIRRRAISCEGDARKREGTSQGVRRRAGLRKRPEDVLGALTQPRSPMIMGTPRIPCFG